MYCFYDVINNIVYYGGSMEIKKFNFKNKDEYKEFIKKNNKERFFDILNVTTLNNESKQVFLLVKKVFFDRYKIIAYCIIEEMLNSPLNVKIFNYSEEYTIGNYVYVSDFYVHDFYRRKGIGTLFAKTLIKEFYNNFNIILSPDGDGYLFWDKLGFVRDLISKREIWVKGDGCNDKCK